MRRWWLKWALASGVGMTALPGSAPAQATRVDSDWVLTLAARRALWSDPVFADLQNIFDLALVAALVRHERLDERVDWDLGVFGEHGGYEPERFDPAVGVMSVVNHRVFKGKDIVVQVAGGVQADALAVVKNDKIYTESPRLESFANLGRAPQLPEGRWWWDSAK